MENSKNKLNSAICHFESGEYQKAYPIFLDCQAFYEAGFCALLRGDTALANELFIKEPKDTPALSWAKSLIKMILLKPFEPIPFFQIRNYLERDINLLINSGLIHYVEHIISYADSLEIYNPEAYKFIGRVLINNKYYDMAKRFLDKSLDTYFNDPEVHLMLAKYWLEKFDKPKAINSAKNALIACPEYFPAKKFISSLSGL